MRRWGEVRVKNRRPIFEAFRAELGGVPAALVPQLDALLDVWGFPREGAAAPAYLGVVGLLSVGVLRAACPERTEVQLAPWVEPIQKAATRFEINTIRRISAFVAQMAHESGLVPGREESLSYTAARMAQVWPRFAANPAAEPKDRVPNNLARSLEHKPEALANLVYANRMGNGPPESGDGWRHRGAGPGQLTGGANWRAFAKAMGMSVDEALAYARTIEGGVMSFAWFWEENDINRLAETPGVTDETKAINGGTHGEADRKARFDRTVDALLVAEKGAKA